MQHNLRLVDSYRILDCALVILKGSVLKERPIWAEVEPSVQAISPPLVVKSDEA